MGKKYPTYYPEVPGVFRDFKDVSFDSDWEAISEFIERFGSDIAVIKDDGNGGVTCVYEGKGSVCS